MPASTNKTLPLSEVQALVEYMLSKGVLRFKTPLLEVDFDPIANMRNSGGHDGPIAEIDKERVQSDLEHLKSRLKQANSDEQADLLWSAQ